MEGAATLLLTGLYGKIPYKKDCAMTSASLDLRLRIRDTDHIAKADVVRCLAVSVFVRDAALRESDVNLAGNSNVAIFEEKSRRFLAACDVPCRLNERLSIAIVANVQMANR